VFVDRVRDNGDDNGTAAAEVEEEGEDGLKGEFGALRDTTVTMGDDGCDAEEGDELVCPINLEGKSQL
jgi:hypothetical protein